jgi:hypothetical protein
MPLHLLDANPSFRDWNWNAGISGLIHSGRLNGAVAFCAKSMPIRFTGRCKSKNTSLEKKDASVTYFDSLTTQGVGVRARVGGWAGGWIGGWVGGWAGG